METSLLAVATARGRGMPELPPPTQQASLPADALLASPVEPAGAFAAILWSTSKELPAFNNSPAPRPNIPREPGTISSRPGVRVPAAGNASRPAEAPPAEAAAPAPVPEESEAVLEVVHPKTASVPEAAERPEEPQKAHDSETPMILPITCAEIPLPVLPVETEAAAPLPAAEASEALPALEAAPPAAQESTSFELNLNIKAGAIEQEDAPAVEPDGLLAETPEPQVETAADPAPVAHEQAADAPAPAAEPAPLQQPQIHLSSITPVLPTRNVNTDPVASPAAPAPAAAPEIILPRETHLNAATVQRIGLVLREADRMVRIDVRQGSEGVRVAVRSADGGMTQHLREGLPELITRLDAQGFDPKLTDSPSDQSLREQRAHAERDANRDRPRQRRRQSAWDPDKNQ